MATFADSLGEAHRLGHGPGEVDELWSSEFQEQAVLIYSLSLPWPYLTNLGNKFVTVARQMMALEPPSRTATEWTIVSDSRYVVAWTVAEAETGELAEAFIEAALDRQSIGRQQLTLHADRGSSMTSKPVAQLLVDLGVARSHSRPSVSNDNPYSEAQFKTLKYCPTFPARFGSIADARAFCEAFFDHYNHIHRHSGIGLHTPASVHYGTATQIRAQRAETLNAAYTANPARFRHRPPTPPKLPSVAWINEPTQEALIQST